jgi:hypothetical protein
MRLSYLPAQVRGPRVPLGGGSIRHRPVIPVRITGPRNFVVRDSLLDTGADETVFEEWIASAIGVDLSRAPTETVSLVNRPPLPCRYATVELRITDMRETCRWPALVGFVPVRLPYQILGHAGFLQLFEAEFRGPAREVVLTPGSSFPGVRSIET